MSYILEALNRSQKERELGEVPTIASPAAVSAEMEKKGVSGLALAAVLLALCAVLIALYAAFGTRAIQTAPTELTPTPGSAATDTPPARPNNPIHAGVAASQVKPSQPAVAPKPAADPAPVKPAVKTPPAPKPPVASKPEVKEPKPSHRSKALETLESTEADLRSDLEKLRDKVLRENRAAATNKPNSRPPVTAPQPPPRQAEPPSTPEEAIPFNRLPSSVQQEIPRRKISVHVYSETASSRFIIINSKKLGEGGQTQDGLKVDEIRPDGAILSYRGRRFFQSR